MREAISSSLDLLDRRDRRLLGLAMLLQMTTSVLDLLGVLLLGLVGALAVATVQSQPPPIDMTGLSQALGLQDPSGQILVLVIAALAAVVLLIKSVLSVYLTRRIFAFLANRQALVSARLSKELLSRPLTFIQRRSSQETAFALINGAGYATIAILGQLSIIVTELSLLAVLGTALLIFSPLVALVAIAFFAAIALSLQRTMGGWAARMGSIQARADIASLNCIQEAVAAYREVTVSDRRSQYIDRIQDLRWQAARVAADLQFVSMFPKYMFEAALVMGGFLLAAFLFATQDAIAAVGTLALFLAAGSRIMPSILRLQGAALGLRSAAGLATPTFELAAELENPLDVPAKPPLASEIREQLARGHVGFVPSVTLTHVWVRYPEAQRAALQDVTVTIRPGQSVALVGRSGAGKSTMADVILGVLDPTSGHAKIGDLAPAESIRKWPGAIGYVPQSVVLANGTVRDNVALGLPREAVDDGVAQEALRRAHFFLDDRASPNDLDVYIGEGGVRLSGGQRQRLGIARALYTRPLMLVLDEATSALDSETEQAITQTIAELDGSVTTVIIAHRLSTVRGANMVIYLEGGRVAASGSFQEVVEAVPSFRRQAKLMGL